MDKRTSDRTPAPGGLLSRRDFGVMSMAAGLAAAAGGAEAAAAKGSSEDITWMPAWRIRELIVKREISPVEVTEHFLARIEEHDRKIRSFAYIDHVGARAQAKQAEQAVLRGERLGLLHGIPVSVKGHIFVKGQPTFDMGTGQDIPSAPWDDVQVERFRQAGAVIFGQNTLMGSGGNRLPASADQSKRMFNWEVEARNPWDTSRVPGWSSSGTAAAVAARLVPIGLGSDGGGSTRLPAAYSGVLGIVATPGRIPWIHPAAPTLALTASTGPMCRDVRDGAIATQALAGPDGRDYFSLRDEPGDYVGGIEDGVKGMRLAWTDDQGFASMYALEESPRVIAAIRTAAQGFTRLGAAVEPSPEKWDDYWAGFEVIKRAYAAGGRVVGPQPTPAEFWPSMESRGKAMDKVNRLFKTYDALLTPTSQLLARKVEDWNTAWTTEKGKYPHGSFANCYTSHVKLFNWLALPAFSVPAGFVDGLPVGLQIVGKPGSEAKMFKIARAFQKAYPQDGRPPGF